MREAGARPSGSFSSNSTTKFGSPALATPAALALHPNHTNPFHPPTAITFELPRAAPVTVRIFDGNGRLVRVLLETRLPAGTRAVAWDGRDAAGRRLASGVYICRLETGSAALTRKIVLIE